MTQDPEFEAIKSDIADLTTFSVRIEHALAGYQTVLQGAEATRRHIADRRDALKWAAALASGGLFVAFQSDVARLGLTREYGLLTLVALFAFGSCLIAAGAYIFVSDIGMSKWLLDTHRLAVADSNVLREVAAGALELREAVERNDVVTAKRLSAHLDRLNDRVVRSGSFREPPLRDRFALMVGVVAIAGIAIGIASLAMRLYS